MLLYTLRRAAFVLMVVMALCVLIKILTGEREASNRTLSPVSYKKYEQEICLSGFRYLKSRGVPTAPALDRNGLPIRCVGSEEEAKLLSKNMHRSLCRDGVMHLKVIDRYQTGVVTLFDSETLKPKACDF